jgi:pantoate--beta-alanine ligase
MLEAESRARVDYVEVIDAATLKRMQRLQGRILLALAAWSAWFGKARLIDNLMAEETSNGWKVDI